jgi:general secretion pathway protein E
VLATLHTNDAVSAATRLIDMGIEPYLLASSLLAVLGQRLVRRCCPACGGPDHAAGCSVCGQTGYQGRSGIYELLEVDEGLRIRIHERATETDMREWAQKQGMRTLSQDGERWVRAGVTTEEELLRVTGDA